MMARYVRAEAIRSRGSALWWLAASGVLLGLILTVFSLAGHIDSATDLLGWQGLLVTGMAAPLATLFAGLAESRERDAREGGTCWRPVSARSTRGARLIFVWAALGLFFLLDFAATWGIAVLFGLGNAATVMLAGFFVWIGALGPAGIGSALTRRYGLIPAIVVAAVWQIELGYFVERDWWWFNPAAWPLRLVLPTMGIKFNLLPLEPGAPMYGESPWFALGLCLLLAAAGAVCAVLVPARRRMRRRFTATHTVAAPAATAPAVHRPAHTTRGAALRAVNRAALTPAVIFCILFAVFVLVFAMRYAPDTRHGLFTFAILPVGAGVLPVLSWPLVHPAWALMRVENPRVSDALCAWCVAVVAFMALLAAVTGGGALGEELRRVTLSVVVGAALTLFSLVVTARFGLGWALALTIVGAIISLTIGGDVLATSPLWILAVSAWPHVADTPLRFVIAGVLGLMLAAAAWVVARKQLVAQG